MQHGLVGTPAPKPRHRGAKVLPCFIVGGAPNAAWKGETPALVAPRSHGQPGFRLMLSLFPLMVSLSNHAAEGPSGEFVLLGGQGRALHLLPDPSELFATGEASGRRRAQPSVKTLTGGRVGPPKPKPRPREAKAQNRFHSLWCCQCSMEGWDRRIPSRAAAKRSPGRFIVGRAGRMQHGGVGPRHGRSFRPWPVEPSNGGTSGELVLLEECRNDLVEALGLFKIRRVAGVRDKREARPGDEPVSSFHRSRRNNSIVFGCQKQDRNAAVCVERDS